MRPYWRKSLKAVFSLCFLMVSFGLAEEKSIMDGATSSPFDLDPDKKVNNLADGNFKTMWLSSRDNPAQLGGTKECRAQLVTPAKIHAFFVGNRVDEKNKIARLGKT